MLPGRYQDVARTLDVPPCSRDKSGAREVVALLPSQKGTWSSMGTLGTLGLESGTFSSQLPTACATTPCMIIVLLWQQLSSIPPGSLRLHIWSLQMCSNLMSGNITTFMMSPPLGLTSGLFSCLSSQEEKHSARQPPRTPPLVAHHYPRVRDEGVGRYKCDPRA
ncbi:C-type natriuretic peptide 3 isoform X2 [Takifugu rubripes]|uniref:C-type natriuretic peptide 3 isoform X2 n=1 Tax=Takifugu rubripes TaxID=31033 RepID=UPI001145E583|nr:C-type natriuretic peptide 3 isoform X2 [Takifugu rubripes]